MEEFKPWLGERASAKIVGTPLTSLRNSWAQDVLDCDLSSLCLPARVGFQDPLLTQIGLVLWRELEQPAPASNLYAQAAAQMLAVHLLRHYTSKGSAVKERKQNLSGLTGRQLKQVVDFIQAHLSQDLSLEDLGILTSLMHKLSKKPGKIGQKANSLMHELFYPSDKICRKGLNSSLTKYFTRFYTIECIYMLKNEGGR